MIVNAAKQILLINYSGVMGAWVIIPVNGDIKGLSDRLYDTRSELIQAIGDWEHGKTKDNARKTEAQELPTSSER